MATLARSLSDMPIALTIAGSDSGGGAGIQGDLKVFFALGCHGTSAITALTAQNTVGVTGIHEVPPEFVIAQIDSIVSDIGVGAAKTGMLASSSIIEAVAEAVRAQAIVNLVVDPVSVSKHGDRLLAEDAVEALVRSILPLALVVTPNLHEAGMLLDRTISTVGEMETAARDLAGLGPRTVLVKGGHLRGDVATDVFFDGAKIHRIDGPRYDTTDTHGTGCALSAAIAARVAHGDELLEAVRYAKGFVGGAIQRGLRIGKGVGPVNPGWRLPSHQ